MKKIVRKLSALPIAFLLVATPALAIWSLGLLFYGTVSSPSGAPQLIECAHDISFGAAPDVQVWDCPFDLGESVPTDVEFTLTESLTSADPLCVVNGEDIKWELELTGILAWQTIEEGTPLTIPAIPTGAQSIGVKATSHTNVCPLDAASTYTIDGVIG